MTHLSAGGSPSSQVERSSSGTLALGRFLKARERREPRPTIEAGARACGELTAALDTALSELTAALPNPSGIAVVAVGGYGRREQSRHSDVDLMLLAEREAQQAASALLYPLWDAKLAVGHSIRDVEQAVAAAEANVETLTALLDARLVAGDAALFERFRAAQRGLARRQRRWLAAELAERRRVRVAAEPWQLASPDLKAGRGGLRDLHTLRWVDRAEALAHGAVAPAPLDNRAPPPVGDSSPGGAARSLDEARETLLAARTALHALSERPGDRLHHDIAPTIAEWLGEELEPWSRRLLGALRTVDAAVAARLDGPPLRDRPSAPRRWLGALRRVGGSGSSEAGTPAGAATGNEHANDATRPLWTALEALGAAGLDGAQPPSLEPLPPAAWLARLLPEWELLRCLPHAVSFHRHPIDVHTERVVAEALRAARIEEEATGTVEAATALADEQLLLLAALLHDIGKGHAGDHAEVGAVIVERVAARLGLDAERSRRLVVAVRHHLLIPTVATRRDIADARVIAEVASAAGDARALHLLYALSVADARATGPDVWGPWKAQLMRQLYLRVLAQFATAEGGAPLAADAEQARRDEAVAETVAHDTGLARDAVRAHLDALPPAYALATPPAEIAAHLRLIETAAGDESGTTLRREHADGVDRLTVVTRDRPGVLSALAGTLAVHSATVLGGVGYTREDGWAIDVVSVDDALGHGIDERRWSRIQESVPLAVAGEFDIDRRLAETRAAYAGRPRERGGEPVRPARPIESTVHVDNVGSDRYSIVEVGAADQPGLLYAITRALNELALDIHIAKVDTVGVEVVDAFYVQRKSGRRVEEPDEIERLRARVIEAVVALDGEPGRRESDAMR
jgi:[protein-PII] uridylyltransferase